MFAVAALLAGCESAPDAAGEGWQVERTSASGVDVVRTLGGGVWGGDVEFVDELVIGVLDGDEEYMFGTISQVAPDGEGGVYVFDSQVPALRHYDAEGRYVRTLGGPGSGPGEYRDAALGIAVLPDGRVVLRDPRNGRFNVYGPGGETVEHWPLASGLFTARATYADTSGHVYAKILTGPTEPGEPWPLGLLRLSPAGEVLDTLPEPSIADEPPRAGDSLSPRKIWDFHPHGYMVVAVTDRYAVELRKPEGTLRIEKAAEPIPLRPEERAELEARRRHTIRALAEARAQAEGGTPHPLQDAPDPPPTPYEKPFLRGVFAGEDGTIWVRIHQEAVLRDPPPDTAGRPEQAPPPLFWTEPRAYDVFEADGTYLGTVRPPPRTTIHTYARSQVWATRRGEFDELYLVRMRIVPRD